MKIFEIYKRLISKYPVGIQAIQTGCLMGSGDLIAQFVVEKKPLDLYEPSRTMQFAFIGTFFVGPPLRIWYGTIDKYFGKKGKISVLKKVAVDQLLFAPIFLATIMIIVAAVQGSSLGQIRQRLSQDYNDVLKSNYKIWPAVQLLNFYLVPLHYQVLAVQIVALFWNSYLSWKMNKTTSQNQ